MKAEDTVLNDSSERQVIEQTCEVLPHVGISIFSQALVIEAVDLGDLLALMITSQNGDSVWVPDFECDEQSDSLNRVVTSINVIPHEKIVVVR